MATVTNTRKVLNVKGKIKFIWHIENKKKKADVSEIWSHKFYNPKDVEKQNHNY